MLRSNESFIVVVVIIIFEIIKGIKLGYGKGLFRFAFGILSSQLLRNVLPYNAVQSYDRIPLWISWMLMIFVGGYIMRLLLIPAFSVVLFVLSRA